MSANDNLPIPAKLTEYTESFELTNYFKQLHDKIIEINQRINELETP